MEPDSADWDPGWDLDSRHLGTVAPEDEEVVVEGPEVFYVQPKTMLAQAILLAASS